MTFHHTLTWNSTMHDLSKTILRHGVPLSIHKLPIYLICPHTLFFSSILRLPILQLFLCHIHLCPHHATHTVSPATCMHSYDCGLPAGIYPHNHKPRCRGVAIVQLLVSIYISVELKSFVRKLLTQFARDRRETWDYYRAPHGDGYKG